MQALNSLVEITVLDSANSIAVLLDSRQRHALLPFVGQACAVSVAAQLVGESANTMLYRVRRWKKLGLLLEVGSQAHSKGQMRLYRTPADAFFVPHHATSSEDLLALGQSVYAPVFAEFLGQYAKTGEQLAPTWGIRFEKTDQTWAMRPVKSATDTCQPTDAGLPPALLDIAQVQLSAAHAKALQLEMRRVLEKYQALSSKRGNVFQVILGLAAMQ
jgi:hypothetical protein